MKKMKNSFSKAKNACIALSTSATTALLATPLAFAAPVDAKSLVKKLVNYIWDIFFYIGVLLLAWSIGMLVLAFKNEDADSKSRAMMLLVVSILLMGISPIFDSLGLLK